MTREIAQFISWCLTCHKWKPIIEATGVLQPLLILELKWEHDYGLGVTKDESTTLCHLGHCGLVNYVCSFPTYYRLWLHIPKLIGSFIFVRPFSCMGAMIIIVDRDPQFISWFWWSLRKAIGTNLHYGRLHYSMAFHPQTKAIRINY